MRTAFRTDPRARREAIRYAEEELGWDVKRVTATEPNADGWIVRLEVESRTGSSHEMELFVDLLHGAEEV